MRGTDSSSGGRLATALLFVTVAVAGVAGVDVSACKALGFAESLMCSGCAKLKTALSGKAGSESLIAECEGCCAADNEQKTV